MRTVAGAPRTFSDHPVDETLQRFFARTLSLSDDRQIESETAAFLAGAAIGRNDFPVVDQSYSRTIIHREKSGFEAIVMRWSKGAVTLPHGHPYFAFYYLLDGKLLAENYSLKHGRLVPAGSQIMLPGDYFCIRGIAGRYDNGIHRISVLEESLSMHIYSDDALKGVCFE